MDGYGKKVGKEGTNLTCKLCLSYWFWYFSWNAKNVTLPWQMPSRGQKFNIIIVKSEMVLDFHHDLRLFGFFFFNAYCLFDVGKNFWAFTDDVRRGSRKVFLCLSCLHSRDDRTTSSEISLLPWNFPLPELDPKSRLLTIYNTFLENPLEGKMEHDSLGRTSGKFPGRTKHPQLGTRLLKRGGGAGGGREGKKPGQTG